MYHQKILLSILLISLSLGLTAQEWEELNSPPFFKHHSNGFGFNGKAYVMEGVDPTNVESTSTAVWEYTPDTDTWASLESFPGPARGFAIGDDWDGKYYYGFGASFPLTYFSDLWVFDPVDQFFTELPTCPCEGRFHPAFVAHNDKIYVGAGSGFASDLRDWWEYDILTQEWSQKPDIPGNIRHHTFQFSIGDEIYVGGGHINNWIKYNPATEEWNAIDNLPEGRVAGTQFQHNDYGYVLAGDDREHAHVPNSHTFMRYDATMDDWEFLPALPNGSRWAPSSFIIDDILYFFGGLSYFMGNDQTMWKFDLSLIDNPPVSTNELSTSDDLIYAFPNPFQSTVNFTVKQVDQTPYHLRVLNVNGQMLISIDDFMLHQELQLSNLSDGLYVIHLSNDTVSTQIKLIKKDKS